MKTRNKKFLKKLQTKYLKSGARENRRNNKSKTRRKRFCRQTEKYFVDLEKAFDRMLSNEKQPMKIAVFN